MNLFSTLSLVTRSSENVRHNLYTYTEQQECGT